MGEGNIKKKWCECAREKRGEWAWEKGRVWIKITGSAKAEPVKAYKSNTANSETYRRLFCERIRLYILQEKQRRISWGAVNPSPRVWVGLQRLYRYQILK